MNHDDHHTYRRAFGVALMGLAVQALATVFLLVIGLWADRTSMIAAAWYAAGGLPLWLCLMIVFHQHKRERLESLEAEQLAGSGSDIFSGSDEDLSVDRRRLMGQYKWLVPILSFIISGYLIGVGLWIYTWDPAPLADELRDQSLTFLGLIAGVVFLLFLLARYAAGMAKQTQWQLLNGGAGFLMGNVLVGVGLIVCLALVTGNMTEKPMAWADQIVPLFMMVIGVEILLNLILGFYRPRRVGEYPRSAFDSRLLSLLASPESITETISETINYQFGFEITRNWFWQMLQRWFPKLVALAAAIIIGITSIIIVQPNQMAIVTDYHLGGRTEPAVYPPGIHFKAPWPLATADHYDVHGIRIMKIGTESDLKSEIDEPAILWTNQHTIDKPEPMIVAAALKNDTNQDGAPLVALVNVEMYLHYRIKVGQTPSETREHLLDYVRANADAESKQQTDRRLRNLATRIITHELLSHTVDEWIGQARVQAGNDLRAKIQKAADETEIGLDQRGLGIHILSVEVAGIHPPSNVAGDFHEVVAAGQEQKTAEQKAEQEAIKILSEAAGSGTKAKEIVRLIDRYDRLAKEKGDQDSQTIATKNELAQLMRDAGGKASELISQAHADRWIKANTERGRVDRYLKHAVAWKNAPRWYAWHLYLQSLGEGMADANKYVVLSKGKELILRGDFKKADAVDPGTLIEELENKNNQAP